MNSRNYIVWVEQTIPVVTHNHYKEKESKGGVTRVQVCKNMRTDDQANCILEKSVSWQIKFLG